MSSDDPAVGDNHDLRIGPYAWTRGRTRSTVELPFEALVRISDKGVELSESAALDERRILDLAASPISVAEVSADMGVVVGVARVLVGDLAARGMLDVQSGVSANRPDAALLERVLDGLKAL